MKYLRACTFEERGDKYVAAAATMNEHALGRIAEACEHALPEHVFQRVSKTSECDLNRWGNVSTHRQTGQKSNKANFGKPGHFKSQRDGAEELPPDVHAAISTLAGELTSSHQPRLDGRGGFAASVKSYAKIFVMPPGAKGAVTLGAHRDNIAVSSEAVPSLATHVTISYATLDRDTRKLVPISEERAAQLELELKNVSGVSFKARHLDPKSERGHARMDKASEIVIRVGHNASYAFDGLANAAFFHEVANAKNPIPGLYRITHVSFMQAN